VYRNKSVMYMIDYSGGECPVVAVASNDLRRRGIR
jgi:hypothetical protein